MVPIPSIKEPEITRMLVLSKKALSRRYFFGIEIFPSNIEISLSNIFDCEVFMSAVIAYYSLCNGFVSCERLHSKGIGGKYFTGLVSPLRGNSTHVQNPSVDMRRSSILIKKSEVSYRD
jgi:hypothetical protein